MSPPGQTGAHDRLRFVVLQPGARMNYAVPALLARAGMLERFYTDICADVGLLRHAAHWPRCLTTQACCSSAGTTAAAGNPLRPGAAGPARVVR